MQIPALGSQCFATDFDRRTGRRVDYLGPVDPTARTSETGDHRDIGRPRFSIPVTADARLSRQLVTSWIRRQYGKPGFALAALADLAQRIHVIESR
ncbi:hypothetical protein GCM10009839_15540 [Catenulispora yoronensis]|uniref:Uncharacterized protein n=1 Tax=Catenulispora yoronensis TaxID=450799 RepID=A0ABN2TTB4_9ACTN